MMQQSHMVKPNLSKNWAPFKKSIHIYVVNAESINLVCKHVELRRNQISCQNGYSFLSEVFWDIFRLSNNCISSEIDLAQSEYQKFS